MKPGDIKVFTKSGNKVRLLARDGSLRRHPNVMGWCWSVERIDGVSVGKRMTCPERALVDASEFFPE